MKKRRNQQIPTSKFTNLLYKTWEWILAWSSAPSQNRDLLGRRHNIKAGIKAPGLLHFPLCIEFLLVSHRQGVETEMQSDSTANWRILLQQSVRMLRKQSKMFHRRPDPSTSLPYPSPSCFSASTAARTLALKLSGGSPTITTATRRKCGKLKRDSKSCEPNRSDKGISLPKSYLLGWGPVRPLQFDINTLIHVICKYVAFAITLFHIFEFVCLHDGYVDPN